MGNTRLEAYEKGAKMTLIDFLVLGGCGCHLWRHWSGPGWLLSWRLPDLSHGRLHWCTDWCVGGASVWSTGADRR